MRYFLFAYDIQIEATFFIRCQVTLLDYLEIPTDTQNNF